MAKLKKIGIAAGTFSVALGIGFVMQNGDALASRFGADEAAPEAARFTADAVVVDVSQPATADPAVASAAPVAGETVPNETGASQIVVADAPAIEEPVGAAGSAVILPQAALLPEPQDAPVQLANLDAEILPEIETDVSADPLECVPTMEGLAGSGAMVKVMVSAPCFADSVFTTHHQGMMFTAKTNAEGSATFTVPALAEVSVIIAAFENGEGAVATTLVPDFAKYDRAVLQWQGERAVLLSAYEGTADFGDEGHIHKENPGTMARLDAAQGGYLMRLGDASVDSALMAEVYTFPSGMGVDTDAVMLVAEAEITAENCGQELSAQSIQVMPSGETSALDLVMTMPDCDAVGDVLILKNMFEDLTLAAR